MTLVEKLEEMKGFPRILVTGPQRSGTRLASYIIAKELNIERIDERQVQLQKNPFEYVHKVLPESNDRYVLHCPELSHICHLLSDKYFIVFMVRNIQEILDSNSYRMRHYNRWWTNTRVLNVFTEKMNKYRKRFNLTQPLTENDMPKLIYDIWHEKQKKEITNYCELEYNLLEQHGYWIPLDERRRKFRTGTQVFLKRREKNGLE